MKNTILLIKQAFKSLSKTKISVILLSIFLIICFWLILGFTFLYSNLHNSVVNLRKDSNLASAMLSTQQQNEPSISYDTKDIANHYDEGPLVKTLNPNKQDPYTLNSTSTKVNPAIQAIKDYYIFEKVNPEVFSHIWAYVSTPGEWNPVINSNNFRTYTSLLMGDNNHYITLNNSFANLYNKNKIPNYVDIWTLYKDGLPLNPSTDSYITNPLNFVVDPKLGYIVGQSVFNDARVKGINVNQSFSVSHVLFDIKSKQPVYSTSIVPSQNTMMVNNNNDTYVASPGVLPNVNTNPNDWKITSNNMPDWSIATPTIKGWSVNALYGRIYKSIARTSSMLTEYQSRIYKPKLILDKLSNAQKIIASLVDINNVQDQSLKQELLNFANQFKNNKIYQEFLTNLSAIINPEITVLQPYYQLGNNQVDFIINNVTNKLSNFFSTIENLALNPISFLNTQPIKLKDIIQKYTSIDNLIKGFNVGIETTRFYDLQTINQNINNYNVIAINKDQNATINKIVGKNINEIYNFKKQYNYVDITNSFRNYLNFANQFGWKTDKFDTQYKTNQAKIDQELQNLKPDMRIIAWVLSQANFLGEYKNLHYTIQNLTDASNATSTVDLVKYFKNAMGSLMFTGITYNDGSLDMSFKVPGKLGWTGATPINAVYADSSYALALVNNSWMIAHRKDKQIIPQQQLNDLMSLPYNQFLLALQNLNPEYTIDVNGLRFIITGIGDSTDFAYPIGSQYVFNKSANVLLYLNQLGFEQIKAITNSKEQIWVGIKPLNNQQKINLNLINQTLNQHFNNQKFYEYDDTNMPNKIMYQSINNPSELANRILLISLFVGILTAILCLVILFIILNHIIKSNIGWIGLAISNGERKTKFIFINWSTSLVLSSIVGLIAGLTVSFTYPLLSFFFYDQWTVPLNFYEVFWIIPVIIVGLFIIIYLGSIFISMFNLRLSLLDLVNQTNTNKKYIKFVSPVKSINLAILMNRFLISRSLKIIGVLFIGVVVSFMASTAIIVNDQLNQSYKVTAHTSNYNFAVDLYSPSIQGGPYTINNFNQIPESTNKPELDIYKGSGFYSNSIEYVTNPYTGIPMTNMWLPDSNSLINQLQNNLQLLQNKMVNQLALNISIPYDNNVINLWDNAIGIFPAPVVNYINQNTNNILSSALAFYEAMDSNNQLKHDYYAAMKANKPTDLSINPWTFNGKAINMDDPDNNMWNKTTNGTWQWTVSDTNSVVSNSWILGFYFKNNAIRLLTYLVTNYQNPVFVKWCQDHNIPVEKPYWLGLNQVSLNNTNNQIEDTYSYVDLANAKQKIRVDGINIDSKFVQLHNLDNQDINSLLSDNNLNLNQLNQEQIPIIINQVASKLDNKKVGDTYEFAVKNNVNRFTWAFNDVKNPYNNLVFKVVAIANTKLKPQYWINKDVADKILGFDVFQPQQRFNGIYYKSQQPTGLLNLTSLYSPSGISTLSSSFPTTYNEMDENILRNPLVNGILGVDTKTCQPILNTILKFNLVSQILNNNNNQLVNYGGQTQLALNAVKKINQIFGSTLIQNSISNADVMQLSHQFANIIDNTVSNFSIIFIVAIMPILLSINLLLISTIIEDINAIFGLLLTQGYSKRRLVGSLTLLVVIWSLIGIVIGTLISLIIPPIFNSIIWSTLNIITNATFGGLNVAVGIGVFGFIGIITWLYGYLKLNNTSILSLIASYQIA